MQCPFVVLFEDFLPFFPTSFPLSCLRTLYGADDTDALP